MTNKTSSLRNIFNIIGYDSVLATVRQWIASNRFPQVVLLHGPLGTGKSLLVYRIAAMFACTQGTGCGTCPGCSTVNSDKHEDCLIFDPQGERIKNETADAVTGHLGIKSYGDRQQQVPRFVGLMDIDLLTDQAGNRLLKTLEEVSSNSVIIMTSSHPERILPTIKSRAFKLFVAPASLMELVPLLQSQLQLIDIQVSEEQALMALKQGGRSLKIAFEKLREQKEGEISISSEIQKLLSFKDWTEKFKSADQLGKQKKVSVNDLIRELEIMLNQHYRFHLKASSENGWSKDLGLPQPSWQSIYHRRQLLSRLKSPKNRQIPLNSQLFLEALSCLQNQPSQYWSNCSE